MTPWDTHGHVEGLGEVSCPVPASSRCCMQSAGAAGSTSEFSSQLWWLLRRFPEGGKKKIIWHHMLYPDIFMKQLDANDCK